MMLEPTNANSITLRPVCTSQCRALVELHRAVFSPPQIMRTIYSAPGVDRYLANLVAYPQHQQSHQLWGAWDGEALVGYAHFRALPEGWHLNNIAVLPTYQGRSIGRMLWQCFIHSALERGYHKVSLYVEADNRRAIDWYQRQGLAASKPVWRYEKGLQILSTMNPPVQPVELCGWEQAEAWQQVYGFSEFQLRYQGKNWAVARPGKYYFRTSQLLPAELEMALIMLDARRRLLIASPEPLFSPDLKEISLSIEMEGDVSLSLERQAAQANEKRPAFSPADSRPGGEVR